MLIERISVSVIVFFSCFLSITAYEIRLCRRVCISVVLKLFPQLHLQSFIFLCRVLMLIQIITKIKLIINKTSCCIFCSSSFCKPMLWLNKVLTVRKKIAVCCGRCSFFSFYLSRVPPHSTTVKPLRSGVMNSCGSISMGLCSGLQAK